jgi:hypothetical protein
MKYKFSKNIWSLFMLVLVTVFASCESHDHSDEENTVSIDLVRPTSGEKIEDPKNTNIAVNFSATVSQHKLEVTLTPMGKPEEKIISWVNNTHEKYFEYRKTVDLSNYAVGTSFLLQLKSCSDHECVDFLLKEFTFSI